MEMAGNKAKIDPSMYAVADLQLAFDNNTMMKMLQNRANALKSAKFEKAK